MTTLGFVWFCKAWSGGYRVFSDNWIPWGKISTVATFLFLGNWKHRFQYSKVHRADTISREFEWNQELFWNRKWWIQPPSRIGAQSIKSCPWEGRYDGETGEYTSKSREIVSDLAFSDVIPSWTCFIPSCCATRRVSAKRHKRTGCVLDFSPVVLLPSGSLGTHNAEICLSQPPASLAGKHF